MIISHGQNSPPNLVWKKFPQTSGTFVLFSREYSFHLCYFGNLFTIWKFAIFVVRRSINKLNFIRALWKLIEPFWKNIFLYHYCPYQSVFSFLCIISRSLLGKNRPRNYKSCRNCLENLHVRYSRIANPC